jgi:glucan biosynthesis protein
VIVLGALASIATLLLTGVEARAFSLDDARIPANADVNLALWIDGNGEAVERHTRRNEVTGGWRSVVRFRRVDRAKPVELRANLMHDNKVVSET